MAKIQFDIQYRPQIESGEYKVETKAGCPVRIVCWDMACELPILGLVLLNDEKVEEIAVGFTNEGTNLFGEPLYDKLFIVTPEEEQTEWQRFISACLQKHGLLDCGAADRIAKESSSELLALAREQFIKDGYVIEKKAFHDAVEKVDPEVMKEVSKNIDKIVLTPFEQSIKEIFYCGELTVENRKIKEVAAELLSLAREQLQPEIDTEIEKAYKNADKIVYDNGVLYGKAEALKDLPRWGLSTGCFDEGWLNAGILYYKFHAIPLNTLEKLPGFKEDEK